MSLINLFKRKNTKKYKRDNLQATHARLGRSQEAVFVATKKIDRPVNGMAVAQYMHMDSASVTPRLAELVKKERLTIAYRKKGLDGMWRKYYMVNPNNMK